MTVPSHYFPCRLGYVPNQPLKRENFMFWYKSTPELDDQLRYIHTLLYSPSLLHNNLLCMHNHSSPRNLLTTRTTTTTFFFFLKNRAEFKDDAERALVDKDFRDCMTSTGEGTVALTLLLDQIPRNIFRSSPRPFTEFDPLARQVVKEALAKKSCHSIHPFFRHFLYMVLGSIIWLFEA